MSPLLSLCLFFILWITCDGMHIVFVLADDLGYTDPHFTNGLSNINTPTIEYYANKGIILDNYYVQPICTPTRSALMSGMYPIHTGLQDKVIRDSVPEALPLIDSRNNKSIIIIPQYLKQHGNYETHMIGKWHLGFYKRKYTPQERGFDHFYGYYTGNEEYWNHTSPCWHCGNFTAIDLGYHNKTNDVWDLNKGGIYSTNLFAQYAVNVIHKFGEQHNNDNKQLFLYLPFEAVHGAASCDPDCYNPYGDLLQAPKYYIDQQSQINNTNRRIFGGMLGALDDGIKNITKALMDIGIWNDTLFIFSTDNGAPCNHFNGTAMTNYPLKGGKGTMWEGGVKGAAFIYSPIFENNPNKYKTGYRYKGMMHITDWYVTFAGILNKNIDILPDLDGYNMWKSLINNVTSPRNEFIVNIDPLKNNQSGIRSGKWKLLQNISDAQWCPLYDDDVIDYEYDDKNSIEIIDVALFDIENDPNERINLAVNNSEIVKELQEKINGYRQTMVPPQNLDPDPNAQDLIISAGFWYSWQDNNTLINNTLINQNIFTVNNN